MDNSQIKNILNGLGVNADSLEGLLPLIKPLLQAFFRLDEKQADGIFCILQKFLCGELNLSALIPVALPLILEYFTDYGIKKPTEQCSADNNSKPSDELMEASPEAFSQLMVYLQNDNASE